MLQRCCDEHYGRLPVDGRSSVAPLGKFLYRCLTAAYLFQFVSENF